MSMHVVKLTCPHCGAHVSARPDQHETQCSYCDSWLVLSRDNHSFSQSSVPAASFPPAFDSPKQQKKRLSFVKILLWIFFFRIMLTIWLFKTPKLTKGAKAFFLIGFWLLVLLYYAAGV